MPRIVEPSEEAVTDAARLLAAGEVVALPTETVYGLGADVMNAAALRKVYEMKGRPLDNPLIAHVRDAAQARSLVREWSDRAETLAQQFWPGPLTLILEKGGGVPNEATAGLPTIAVRSPSHPVARALLEAFGRPIAAPSANRSGHVSPTRAEHVANDFADVADLLILDGGSSACGIESTVLDMTALPLRIMRPGSVGAERIAVALGEEVETPATREQVLSPGTSPRHYAPRTPVMVLDRAGITARLRETGEPVAAISLGVLAVEPPHRVIEMPVDSEPYAAQLYDALRRADAFGASMILIEQPPRTTPMWQAVQDRLERAAARA